MVRFGGFIIIGGVAVSGGSFFKRGKCACKSNDASDSRSGCIFVNRLKIEQG